MPLLFSSCTVSIPIPNDTPSAFAALPLGSFDFSFFHNLSSKFCTLSLHFQMLCPFFLFASQRSNNLTSSSSFFRMWAPPLHAVGFEILFKSPALPSALRIICATFLLMHLLHLCLLNFFSLSLTTHTTSAWCLPILDGSTLSLSLPPTAQ